MKSPIYTPELCSHCGQSTTYLLAIDRGTVQIVKQIARFINKKGINVVHPRKEMEGIYLSSNEVGNLTHARAHGLIAKIKGEAGNYCLTTKGAQFLRGSKIPKYAIRSKVEHKTIGYFEPDTCTAHIIEYDRLGRAENGNMEYWEGINFTVEEGRIIQDPVAGPKPERQPALI